MKKNALLILATSALLALTGCSASPIESSSDADSSETISSEVVSSEPSPIVSSESVSLESSDASSSEQKEETSSEDAKVSSEEEIREFDISAESDGGANVVLAKEKASAGTEVHFTVTALTGFKIEEVSARAGSVELDLVVGFDGDYSFTMPKRGVAIKVTTSRKSYKLTTNDAGGFLKSVTQKKVGSNSYVALDTITEESEPDEEGESVTSSYKTAQFGAEILLTFNTSVSNYMLTGISVNGVATELKADAESYSFVMGAEDTSVSISYSYKTVAFELVDSEHISLSLYSDSNCEDEIEGAYIPYSTVYLKATPSNDGYGVKTITCVYTSSSGNTTSKDLTSLYDEDTGLYSFQYPMATGTITITVTEYDLHAYKNASFVGEYMNLDFSYGPAQDYDSFADKCTMRILESGDLVYNRSETSVYTDYSVSSFEENDGVGLIKLAKSGSYALPTIAYSKDLLVYDAYLKDGVYSSSDIMVSLKKDKEEANYSVEATQFKIGDVTYALACFYEGDTSIENVLIERTKADYAKNTIHFGVSVEMLEGASVNEDKAIFRVKEGDATLLSIGYTGEGKAKNRVALGEQYGTYVDSDGKTLYLNGSGSATYDGKTYAYVADSDGVTVVLTSNAETITVTIDLSGKTFAITSREEISIPAWYGKTYVGKPSDDGFNYTVVFDDSEMKLTWNEYTWGTPGSSSPYYHHEATYEINNGTTITTLFYDAANTGGKKITLVYNPAGDTFSVTSNENTSGANFSNSLFSLLS